MLIKVPSRQTHKVSLEPYRRASMKILRILQSFTPQVEKASIGR
jgi:nucleotidyltransferase/DNA polymerase involved in DNA repair